MLQCNHTAQPLRVKPFGVSMRLALALFLALATPAMADMTDAERTAFRAEVRAYLMENPEVLAEAMNELQARQDAAAAQADLKLVADNKAAIFDDGVSWVGGNPNGDVTIVEFMDYRCGYCRKAFSEVDELVKSDGNIRFVVKEFPILGEQSLLSSQFAIAVRQLHGDAAYLNAHNALISLRGDATPQSLGLLAADLGLDPAPIIAAMASPAVKAVIDANHALGGTMQIDGTPTFIVDGTMLRGYLPLDDMRKVVAEERKG
jgi:protein-disulfide isomerase